MVYRDPKGSLGQDPLGKTILLYSAEGLLPFGTLSTGPGPGKSMPKSMVGDAEFLGDAPDRPVAPVEYFDSIEYVLLRVSHMVLMKLPSKNEVIWPTIDLVVVS